MSNAYIGEIRAWGCSYAPRSWMFCNGQTMSIQQYSALFSILGTQYGGNGTTTFLLPNLNGYATVSQGQGPGLQDWSVGEKNGTPTVALALNEMPQHIHQATTKNQTGAGAPIGTTPSAQTYLARLLAMVSGAAQPAPAWVNAPPTTSTQLHPMTVGPAGGGQPHNNQQPYLALNWAVCIEGVYPARN